VDEEAGRHLYYYMALSEGDPQGDPVLLWMNGGPVRSDMAARVGYPSEVMGHVCGLDVKVHVCGDRQW
jgi:hypothetical protein